MAGGTLILITGASRGIGRACAIAFAQRRDRLSRSPPTLPPPSLRLCLVARSLDGLVRTADLVQRAVQSEGAAGAAATTADSVTEGPTTAVETTCHAVDLSDLDALEEKTAAIYRELRCGTDDDDDGDGGFDRAVLINNAGSLGHVGPSDDLTSLSDLRGAVDLNVTSSAWLSSDFVRRFGSPGTGTECTVVNVSSLCAIEPFETLGTYCAGKAARDMFHAVLAKELSKGGGGGGDRDGVKVLNYAPGVVDTDMTVALSESEDLEDGLSSFYRGIAREGEGRMLTSSESARRLVELLDKDEYQSGAHIDYWDGI